MSLVDGGADATGWTSGSESGAGLGPSGDTGSDPTGEGGSGPSSLADSGSAGAADSSSNAAPDASEASFWTEDVGAGDTGASADAETDAETGVGGTPDDAGSLVFYETFDSVGAILQPAIGPTGTLDMGGGAPTLVSGFLGSAYYVQLATANVLSYPGSIVPPDRGTIQVYAQLYTPPAIIPWGNCPFFFQAPAPGVYTGYQMGFNGNDGWFGGGLVGWAGQGSIATGCYEGSYTYEDILGAGTSTWHRYSIAWDINGVPGTTTTLQLYLDGQPVGTSSICGQDHHPTSFGLPATFMVGVIQSNFSASAVALDELRIWNYARVN